MNTKKSKAKKMSKKAKNTQRRKIKQVGCSLMKGGDAYNEMPAHSIYPREDYTVDVQRHQLVGGKRSFRKFSRKYYKKQQSGGQASFMDYGKSSDFNSLDNLYSKSNPFYA